MSLIEAARLLDRLRAAGITLWAEAGRLRYRAPQGTLTEEWRAEVALRRSSILRLLEAGAEPGGAAVRRAPGPVPLTPAQSGIWVSEQGGTAGDAYHIAAALDLHGPLDMEGLRAAWTHLVARHEALRSFVVMQGDRPAQDSVPELSLPFSEAGDLSEAEADAWLKDFLRRPFDLSRPPLWRIGLCRTGAGSHLLTIVLHHLIADGGSVDVLLREFATCYGAAIRGEAPALTDAPPGLPDIAARIAARRQEGAYERDLRYWEQSLAAAPSTLELWPDRPRPVSGARPAIALYAGLDGDVTAALRRLASSEGTTLFAALWTLFAILLHRYGAGDDIVVATPHLGRDGPGLDSVVGLLTNRVALHADLSGEQSFRTLLRRNGETLRSAFAHAEVPFELIVDRLSPPRDGQNAPYAQVLFAMQNAVRTAFSLGGLEIVPRRVEAATAKADIYLAAEEDGPGVALALEFPPALFERSRMERLLQHFTQLAHSALATPDVAAVELPIMGAEERGLVLQAAARSGAAAPDWKETRVEERFDAIAAAMLDAPALHGPSSWEELDDSSQWSTLTYGELRSWSEHIAARLSGAGPVVAVALPRSAAMVAAMLGILRAGAAYLPLDSDLPAARVANLRAQTGATTLVTQAGDRPEWADQFAQVIDPLADADDPRVPRPETPSDLAYVLFTSGSTGQPKGIGTTHANVLHFVGNLPVQSGERPPSVLQFAPVSFDASVMEIWGALLHGARLVIAPPGLPDFDRLGRLLRLGEVTFAWLTAGLFHAMAETAPAGLFALEQLVAGGDALAADRIRLLLDSGYRGRIANGYGPTETTVLASWHDITRADICAGAHSVPIGRAFGAARLYCLDRRLEPVPFGTPGELVIGGPGVAKGYIGQPDLTEERFLPDPFAAAADARMYRTGDRVRVRDDGIVEFLGRFDDQVKIRGFRVELGEIVSALRTHPAVADAAVVASASMAGAERRLVAYVVLRPESGLEADALRNHLAGLLPDQFIPAAYVFLPELPLTRSGKLDRQALPPPSAAPRAPSRPLPPGALQALGAIWRELLHLDVVDPEDRFFESGGDSILAIQLVNRAARAGWSISTQDVLRHQTLRGQAAVARKLGETAGEETAAEATTLSLTPIHHWFMSLGLPRLSPWNQAVRLRLRPDIGLDDVRRAMTELEACHQALRLRLREEGGRWSAAVAAPEATRILTHALAEGSEAALEEALNRLHHSLDPQRGPVWAALWIEAAGTAPELVLAAHHLVIDGVSWRILLDDLGRLLAADAPITLPRPRAGPGDWERFLRTRADIAVREEAFWLALPSCPALAIPAADGPNREGEAAVASIVLEPDVTADLLGPANAAWRTSVTELLLAGVALGYRVATGVGSILVDVEHHGRDAAGAPDLSRTIGWFTTIAPLALTLPDEASLPDGVQAVKKAARAAPDAGIGYGLLRYMGSPEVGARLAERPRAQVSVNYLGRIGGQAGGSGGPFSVVDSEVGPAIAPEAPRPYEVEIVALATDDGLTISWRFASGRHDPHAMQRWAAETETALRAIRAACIADTAGRVSREDFPLLPAQPADAPSWPQNALAAAGIVPRDVEDLLPLAPQQLGALFETLAEPERGLHVEQFVITLSGPLDQQRLRDAWAAAIAWFPALRTAFLWRETPEPLQAVLWRAPVDWTVQDWRDVQADATQSRLDSWLESDRRRGYRPDTAPLMRHGLFRVAEQRWLHVWSFHHILLDGWSVPIVLKAVMDDYVQASAAKADPTPEAGPDAYIAWLRAQPEEEARLFWQAELAGPFRDRPPEPSRSSAGERAAPGSADFADTESVLPPELSQALDRMARRHGVTLGTVVLAAWGIVMASGGPDVVVGITTASRPPDLPGSEDGVGLFINTLPFRIRIPSEEAVWDWLAEVQRHGEAIRRFAHCSTGQIHRWSGLPMSTPLFDSLFVFENYPLGQLTAPLPGDIRIDDVSSRGARTRHPLTLLAMPGQGLGFRLVTDRASVHPTEAVWHLDALSRILSVMATAGSIDVAALRNAVPPRPTSAIHPIQPADAPQRVNPALTGPEREVAELWRALLGAVPLQAEDRFFDLGGHSLLVLELLRRWRERFGFDLPLARFLRDPTIAGMARLLTADISEGETPERAALVPLSATGATRLFLAPGASGNPFAYSALAAALGDSVQLLAHDGSDLLDGEDVSVASLGRDFAAAVDAFQADGPLRIAGHSLGAAVAFAAAAELRRRGRDIGSLILIDQPAPGTSTPAAPADEAGWLSAIADAATRYLGRDIAIPEVELRRLEPAARRSLLLGRMIEAGALPADSKPLVIDALLRRYQSAFSACASYRPEPVDVDAVLIRGRDSDVTGAADLGWRDFCRSCIVVTVPGDHISMITPQHAGTLADQFLAVLKREAVA